MQDERAHPDSMLITFQPVRKVFALKIHRTRF